MAASDHLSGDQFGVPEKDPIRIPAEMARQNFAEHDPLARRNPADWKVSNVETKGIFPMSERWQRHAPNTHHAVYRYTLTHVPSGKSSDEGAILSIGTHEGKPQGGGFGSWSGFENFTLPLLRGGRY